MQTGVRYSIRTVPLPLSLYIRSDYPYMAKVSHVTSKDCGEAVAGNLVVDVPILESMPAATEL